MIGSGGFKTISRLNNTQALDKPAQGCQEIESACSCSVSPEWKVVYEGDAGKQGRPRTSADPRGATETRGWLRRDIVHVHAAGVTPTELLWYPTTHTKSGTARMRAVPGHEFSGVIAAIGKDVQDFKVGDEVNGKNDWFADGATAEFCITLPQNIARKPATLSHEAAA